MAFPDCVMGLFIKYFATFIANEIQDLVKGDVVTHILSHFGQFISPYIVCELTSCDIYYLSDWSLCVPWDRLE